MEERGGKEEGIVELNEWLSRARHQKEGFFSTIS